MSRIRFDSNGYRFTPGIDGVHATMLIRERELVNQKKRVPIVALTGHADRQRVMTARYG